MGWLWSSAGGEEEAATAAAPPAPSPSVQSGDLSGADFALASTTLTPATPTTTTTTDTTTSVAARRNQPNSKSNPPSSSSNSLFTLSALHDDKLADPSHASAPALARKQRTSSSRHAPPPPLLISSPPILIDGSPAPGEIDEPKPRLTAANVYPDYMACRSAFDQAFYCLSIVGQFHHLYRYGTVRLCPDHWNNFWFCVQTKAAGYSDEEKKRRVLKHYWERDRKYRVGLSSEDVWTQRETLLEDAFMGDFKAFQKEMEEEERRKDKESGLRGNG